jgi:uncharacterized protein
VAGGSANNSTKAHQGIEMTGTSINRDRAESMKYKVCIVGLGPAGLAAALTLSESKLSQDVICLEQGDIAANRSCSILQNDNCEKEPLCRMITGIGGSSLLSGGKISAFPAGSRLVTILGGPEAAKKRLEDAIRVIGKYVPLQPPETTDGENNQAIESFRNLGFNYKYFDVYRFDQEELRRAYDEICRQLESAGISVLVNTLLINAERQENAFKLTFRTGGRESVIVSECLILAVGRSGQGIIKRLNSELKLGGKDGQLEVGVRLEFPTALLPDVTRYHDDLKLHFNEARTFCVCREGKVAPYILDGVFFSEGYSSPRSRSGFTNLGIMKRLEPSNTNELLLTQIKQKSLQQRDGKLICQMLPEYLSADGHKNGPSVHVERDGSYWTWGNINDCFPPGISATIKEAVYYFVERLLPRSGWREVKVYAPEADYGGTFFPVDPNFSISPGQYIIGDCTGQFRGIAQAFCSGITCAEGVIGYLNGR